MPLSIFQIVGVFHFWKVKRLSLAHHFVEDDTYRPPIWHHSVLIFFNDLWCPSCCSSTCFCSPFIIRFELMGQTEITNHQICFSVNQHVSGLYVSMHDVSFMEVSKGWNNLNSPEDNLILLKTFGWIFNLLQDHVSQVSALWEWKNKEDVMIHLLDEIDS